MLTSEWLDDDDDVHLHASVRLVAANDGPATDAAAASAVMVMQQAASYSPSRPGRPRGRIAPAAWFVRSAELLAARRSRGGSERREPC
jgi:hypothetical protein